MFFTCSIPNYEREKQMSVNNYETKIEQLQKKAKSDLDREKEEKDKAIAKVSIMYHSFCSCSFCACLKTWVVCLGRFRSSAIKIPGDAIARARAFYLCYRGFNFRLKRRMIVI